MLPVLTGTIGSILRSQVRKNGIFTYALLTNLPLHQLVLGSVDAAAGVVGFSFLALAMSARNYAVNYLPGLIIIGDLLTRDRLAIQRA